MNANYGAWREISCEGFREICCASLCQKYRHWQTTFGNFTLKEKNFGNSVFISWKLVHFPGCSPLSSWFCSDELNLKWKHINFIGPSEIHFYVPFNRPNRNGTPLAHLMPLKMVPLSYTLHCIHFLTGLRTMKLKWKGKYHALTGEITKMVIFLDFHSTRQGLPLVDSWSHGLD